jgi:GTP pyrophosphokinase
LFAPLAGRLGVWQLKWQLEDASLRYVEPAGFDQISNALNRSRPERERYVARIVADLRRELSVVGIPAEITGRSKHVYSIWNKMRHKGIGFDQVHDLLAVRIVVDQIADCYAALGQVHGLWRHPEEFDDYIAQAQSERLPFTPHGRPGSRGPGHGSAGPHPRHAPRRRARDSRALALQGRRWRGRGLDHLAQGLSRCRRHGWQRPGAGAIAPEGIIEHVRTEALKAHVYVLTPKGRVIELPLGATALDFAYAVHTEVGHRCRVSRPMGPWCPLPSPCGAGK